MMPGLEFNIERGDVCRAAADVLALKSNESFHGAAEVVAGRLEQGLPPSGGYRLLATKGRVAATHALFVDVGKLYEFNYREIRRFAARVLEILAHDLPDTQTLAMTIQGANYGLDETEAMMAQLAGYADAINARRAPLHLSRITLVDHNAHRVELLRKALTEALRTKLPALQPQRKHVFVAMPFDEDLEDVFYYGIRGPVHEAGYLCERVDLSAYTGDVLERIRMKIETAAMVIADLSRANPNVYLEVGYAWGKGVPTVLLVRNLQELCFDVRGQRCLVYKSIKNLETLLGKELERLHA